MSINSRQYELGIIVITSCSYEDLISEYTDAIEEATNLSTGYDHTICMNRSREARLNMQQASSLVESLGYNMWLTIHEEFKEMHSQSFDTHSH